MVTPRFLQLSGMAIRRCCATTKTPLSATTAKVALSTAAVSSSSVLATTIPTFRNQTIVNTYSRSFSSEPVEEEKIVPGINKGKTATGLVGLDVEPDWYNVMIEKFTALLDKMEASDMPETAQYRIDVTKWCNYVLKQVRENPDDPEAIEDACRQGQVEELIELAKDEMEVLDMYLDARIWELVEQAHPTKIEIQPDPLKDPFDKDGDKNVQDAIREGIDEMKKETEKK